MGDPRRDEFPNNFVGDLVHTAHGWVVVPPTCCPDGHATPTPTPTPLPTATPESTPVATESPIPFSKRHNRQNEKNAPFDDDEGGRIWHLVDGKWKWYPANKRHVPVKKALPPDETPRAKP